MANESNTRWAFETLFGKGAAANPECAVERHKAGEHSRLYLIMQDAMALKKELGRSDQRRLDEYLTGVREIQKRIQSAERFGIPRPPSSAAPRGIPASHTHCLRLMFEMLARAFQTASARVASFLMADDEIDRNFPDIGCPSGQHKPSHHQRNPKNDRTTHENRSLLLRVIRLFPKKLGGMKEPNGK